MMKVVLLLVAICVLEGALAVDVSGSDTAAVLKVGSVGAVPALVGDKYAKDKKSDAEYIEAVLKCFVNGEFKKDLSPACAKIHDEQAKALEQAIKYVPPKDKHQKAEKKSHELAAAEDAKAAKKSLLEMHSSAYSDLFRKKKRKTPYLTTALWDRGLINYAFGGTTADSDMGKRAVVAMGTWMEKTCVRFKAVASDAADKKMLLEKDATNAKCACGVGQPAATSKCTLSHAGQDWGQPGPDEIGCPQGTLLHELGHVLGLSHTHNRIDRDKYFTVDPSVVGDVNYAKKTTAAKWADGPMFPDNDPNKAADNLFSSQMCYPTAAAAGSEIQSLGTEAAALAKLADPSLASKADTSAEVKAKIASEAARRAGLWQRGIALNDFDAATVNLMYECLKIKLSCAAKQPALSKDVHISKKWQWGDFLEVVKSIVSPAQVDGGVAFTKYKFAVGATPVAAPGAATDAIPAAIATADVTVTLTFDP